MPPSVCAAAYCGANVGGIDSVCFTGLAPLAMGGGVAWNPGRGGTPTAAGALDPDRKSRHHQAQLPRLHALSACTSHAYA